MNVSRKKSKLSNILRWVFWVFIAQFILINMTAAFYAYKLSHFYTDPSQRVSHDGGNIFQKTWKLFTGPSFVKSQISFQPTFEYDTVKLYTKSGLAIDGWYSKSDSIPKGTVLIFHGITANKGMLLAEANEFRYEGYNVFLVDFRAHGNSDGVTTTLGVREAEEVKLAYDYLKSKGEQTVFLLGSSMGAVVVAKAVSDYALRPAGIILELPFASLQSHLKARARNLGFPQQPFAFLVTGWMGLERGFNGYRHITARYARNITCPVLVQYGEKDKYVLKKEVDEVYAAITSVQKKRVGYVNAGHESLLQNDPVLWRSEVGAFLKQYKK